MSNYPPSPGYPQQPGYPNPTGYGGSGVVGQQKTSAIAIASLVCGLLFCIPFVTSLAATILGLIGIGSTSKPNVGGRALAIIGLLLGLLGLAGWGVGGYYMYNFGTQAYAMMTDVSKLPQTGDFTSLSKYASGVPVSRLQGLTDEAKKRGGIKDVQIDKQDSNASKQNEGAITGTLLLGDGSRVPFRFRLGLAGGKLSIDAFEVDFDKALVPAGK